MKVYCRDCKYYKTNEHQWSHGYTPFQDWCISPANEKTVDNYGSQVVFYITKPRVLNEYNNCTCYKKKWWKFL